MKVLVITALAASMAVGGVVAASGQDILIFGDSTGKGDGAQRRWHQRLLETLPHAGGRRVFYMAENDLDRPTSQNLRLDCDHSRPRQGVLQPSCP